MPPTLIAIDARMIHHSGIGVALRRILAAWAQRSSARFLLLGDPARLRSSIPAGLDASIVPWHARLYGLSAALLPPALPARPDAWYAPHYATCLRPPAPLVCHVQDLLHITHPPRLGTRPFQQAHLHWLRRRARLTLTTSRLVKVQLQTVHRFPPERVWTTGLGPGEIESNLPALPLPAGLESGPYLVAVGIDKPHKNWDLLLAALARPAAEGLRLAAIGLGDGAGELMRRAQRAGVAARIVVLPRLEPAQLAAVYRGAVALAFPSIAEGFGLPLLEAMSLGTPAIHAARAPMSDIAGAAGFPFDPDEPSSFDAALRLVREAPDVVAARTELGRQLAGVYTWERTARITMQAIEWAIGGGAIPPDPPS
jgi:glycosyltransferase involved in cell wall biosynthesis